MTRRTRLAPSPTGSLHLGNARTFALTWALARNEGWAVTLRIEDLDVQRVKSGAVEETIELLAWLGLDHDGAVEVQSRDLEPYRAAMRQLGSMERIFRCRRSRADVRRAASAPHSDDGETRFPPELRPQRSEFGFLDDRSNHRLVVDPGEELVEDELVGRCRFDPGREVGDFLVWTKLGMPSYQLAVVVDDLRAGVSDVVRGDDLLASAARQQLLHRLLGGRPPRWWHLPLVRDAEGHRMAKRRDSTSLLMLRQRGVPRERVIGLVAHWCGWLRRPTELSLADFRPMVTPDTLRRMAEIERDAPCRASEEHVRWLES